LEKRSIIKIEESTDSKNEMLEGINDLGYIDLACGSDFVLALKTDGNIYSMG
jgi:alpha-tubulin suppressor-like RCC1 family protein